MINLLKDKSTTQNTTLNTPSNSPPYNGRLFTAYIHNNGLIAPIYRRLKESPSLQIDAPFFQDIKLRFVQDHFRNQKQVRVLHKLSELLGHANIPFLCLKGPVLSQSLFGNTNARSSNDLDILVDFKDLYTLHEALIEAGYKRIFPAHDLTPIQTKVFYARDCVTKYDIDGVLLEVHWRLFENPYLMDSPFKSLLKYSQPVSIEGTTFKQPGQTDLLLYLISHGAKHQWIQLKWLYDIHAFLKNTSYDLDEIHTQAEQSGLEDILHASFYLCSHLFGTQDNYLTHAPRPLSKHQRLLLDSFLSSIIETTPPFQFSRKRINACIFLRQLHLKKDWHYRFRLLIRWAVNTEDWHTCPLPDYLFPLYPLIRPYLWLKKKKSPRK